MKLQATISKVKAADYPRVVEVWEATVRATHHFVKASDIEVFRPIVADALKYLQLACLRDETGQVVGYIAMGEDKMVEMLFIHPDWRGHGIGRRLLTYAIKEWGADRLDVNEQNEQAMGFYLHMGFIVAGRSDLDGFGKPYPLLHLKYMPTANEEVPSA